MDKGSVILLAMLMVVCIALAQPICEVGGAREAKTPQVITPAQTSIPDGSYILDFYSNNITKIEYRPVASAGKGLDAIVIYDQKYTTQPLMSKETWKKILGAAAAVLGGIAALL